MPRQPTPIGVPASAVIAAAALGLLATLYTMATVPAVPRILFGGIVLAMFLWYPLRWLERFIAPRFAIPVLALLVVASLGLALLLLVPPLIDQLRTLIADAPTLADRAGEELEGALAPFDDAGLLPGDANSVANDLQAGLIARMRATAEGLLGYSLGAISSALGAVVQAFGVVFVGLSLLANRRRLRAIALRATPRHYRRDVHALLHELSDVLSRYLVGMLVVAALQGVTAAIFLRLIGVPYPELLAAWIAATSTIPYIGTWFGGGPAIALAALQSPFTGLLTFGAFFASTTVIGNVITPRIQGDAVGVHPILVLLGVVAFGGLFGLLGVFLAVPTLAVLRVLFDFLRPRLQFRRPPSPYVQP